MATRDKIRKICIFFVAPVIAAYFAFYGCDFFVIGSIESPHRVAFIHGYDFYPWVVIQFVIAFAYWYLMLQAAMRNRLFAGFVFLPLLMEFTFSGYLKRVYPGLDYATVVQSSLCTSFEQMGTYADVRLFTEWGVEIVAVLLYVFFLHQRLWGGSDTNGRKWFAAWCGMVIVSFLPISSHNSLIPNARYQMAKVMLDDFNFRLWVGREILESPDVTDNPRFRMVADREKISDRFLPYSRMLLWGDAVIDAIFPSKVRSAAEHDSYVVTPVDKLCVVLYVGESYRQDHTPFSGYHRNTLPLVTAHHSENIIVFPNVISYDTQTISCMYGILSDATSENRKASNSSFMSIFRKHGFHCTIADGTLDGAPWHNAPVLGPVLSGSYDELTEYTETKELQALARRKLECYALNMLLVEDGSCHFPYDEATGGIWGNDMEAKYDEARLKSDEKLDALICELEHQPAVLLYVSDHAESLGEGGRFCHGGSLDVMEQRRTAAFLWYSDEYARLFPDVISNLRENAETFTSQDQIFHTMPTLGGIHSSVQDSGLDVASPKGKSEKDGE